MSSYIGDINDLNTLCATVALELDLPDDFYRMEVGTGQAADISYFRIKDKTFASSQPRNKGRLLRFSKTFTKADHLTDLNNVAESKLEYNVPFGFDLPVETMHTIMHRLINDVAERCRTNPFGCCHRYIECSDAMKCIHPDKALRFDCLYRQNLKSGRIFYGKNRNLR